MTTIVIPVGAPRVPEPAQMARNGLHVNSFYSHRLLDLANHVAKHRPKCVASFTTPQLTSGFPLWTAPTTTRDRWRFVFHSSPNGGQLRFDMLQARQQLDAAAIHGAAGSLEMLVSTIGGAAVAKATIAGAPGSLALADNTIDMRNFFRARGAFVHPTTGAPVNLTPDTDYEAVITEKEFARIVGVTIFEESLPADTANGYVDPNIAVGSPILDSQREGVATILRSMWKRGSAHLFNWSRLLNSSGAVDSPATTSATFVNLIDGSSTSVTGSTPGVFFDFSTGLVRLKDAGAINATMQVYAKCTSNGNGEVKFQQQSGGVITAGPFTTSFSWVSASDVLDATDSKVDLMFRTAAGTLTVGAVSVYLHE